MQRRKFLGTALAVTAGLAAVPLLGTAAALAQATAENSHPEPPMPSSPHRIGFTVPSKARLFIPGSSSGLGFLAAQTLLAAGHDVIIHIRSQARRSAVDQLVSQGAVVTTGDLSDLDQTRRLAEEVNDIGRMDAIIHNAGVLSGPELLAVNVLAPYLLTVLIQRPKRLIYLSSNMHRSGSANLTGLDWSRRSTGLSYSDSKLFVTTFAAAVARLWPEVLSNAVDPGWVPTKMGGPNAPDDLKLGHLTQEWLATSNDPEALTSGRYWHHQQPQTPHPAVNDVAFQDQLLAELARATGTELR